MSFYANESSKASLDWISQDVYDANSSKQSGCVDSIDDVVHLIE